MNSSPAETLFWKLAAQLYADPAVEEGTMMGFKCLRVGGAFFATLDHKNDALIVKLPKDRVGALVEEGTGRPFAPNGRVFREWVSVPQADEAGWLLLLNEAKTFVRGPS